VSASSRRTSLRNIRCRTYFRMYKKARRHDRTALTEAEEFNKIYMLDVTPDTDQLEYQAFAKARPWLRSRPGTTRTSNTPTTPARRWHEPFLPAEGFPT